MNKPTSPAPSMSLNEDDGDFETLTEKAYRRLRDDILSGRLKPGTRLVRRTLGKEYGVSAIPIMEALWRHERDGLVESQTMYGARVKKLTSEWISNSQAMREAIECQVAREVATRATPADLDHLMKLAIPLDEIQSSHDVRSKEGAQTHLQFHLAVAGMSGFPVFSQQLERVWASEFMVILWISSALQRPPSDWHQQLVRSLSTGDPDHAERKMREHIRFGKEQLIEAMRKIEETTD
jgi:DNA-binding GntR family transcriptional regulator